MTDRSFTLLAAVEANTTGAWQYVTAGKYALGAIISDTATVTFQFSQDGSTGVIALADSSGAISYTGNGMAVAELPNGYVRATAAGYSAGTVTAWVEPVDG